MEEHMALKDIVNGAVEKKERVGLADLNQQVVVLVKEFAEAKAAEAKIKATLEVLKERAIAIKTEYGLDDLQGPQGTVKIIEAAGPTNLDKKAVQALLTEEQYKSCLKTGKASTKVQFDPPKVQ
jgi:hypothetical protein